MERISRAFYLGVNNQFGVQVITRGNFSTFLCSIFLDLSLAVIDIFSQFEEQLNLRITHWEVLENRCVVFRHEPKEKAKVVHLSLPGLEPDISL